MHEASTGDALAKLDEPLVEFRAEDAGSPVDRITQDRLDLVDRRGNRARCVDPRSGGVIGHVVDQVAVSERPEVPVDLDVSPTCRSEAFHQPVRRYVKPHDVPAAVQPGPDGSIGNDAIRCDDPPKHRARVDGIRESHPGDGIGSPSWIAGEIDESGMVMISQRLRHASGAGSRGPDQHCFHPAITMPLHRPPRPVDRPVAKARERQFRR